MDVLKRFNIKECKPIATPFEANSNLLELSDEKFENVQRKMKGVLYKARVGFLMYAMVPTRVDIAFAMSTVSQFMSKAAPLH